jgi:hypothetical protein
MFNQNLNMVFILFIDKNGMKHLFLLICLSLTQILTVIAGGNPTLKMGLLKYNGGGDWYANPTSLVNLAAFL